MSEDEENIGGLVSSEIDDKERDSEKVNIDGKKRKTDDDDEKSIDSKRLKEEEVKNKDNDKEVKERELKEHENKVKNNDGDNEDKVKENDGKNEAKINENDSEDKENNGDDEDQTKENKDNEDSEDEESTIECHQAMLENVKVSYILGYSKPEALVHIFGLIEDLETPSLKEATQLVDQFENPQDKPVIENESCLVFLKMIHHEYLHFDYQVGRYIPGFALSLKNDPLFQSYAVGCRATVKPIELMVMDCFHDEIRNFKFVGQELPYSEQEQPLEEDEISPNPYSFLIVNPQHILAFQCSTKRVGRASEYPIYLIQLDYAKKKCKILSEQKAKMNIETKILSDSKDSKSFVIINRLKKYTSWFSAQLGHVNLSENKLHINIEKEKNRDVFDFSCLRLQNGILSGFGVEFDLVTTTTVGLYYWTHSQGQYKKQFNFNQLENLNLEANFNDFTPYAWFEEECFVFIKPKEFQNFPSYLYSFNVLTKKRIIIDYNFYDFSNFHVDYDGNLVAGHADKLFYFDFRKPQKLQHLIWRHIQRLSKLLDKKALHNEALKRLPLNSDLRPFSFAKN